MADAGEPWTVPALRAHLAELREADKEALRVALAAAEKRLDAMNEFRSARGTLRYVRRPRGNSGPRMYGPLGLCLAGGWAGLGKVTSLGRPQSIWPERGK